MKKEMLLVLPLLLAPLLAHAASERITLREAIGWALAGNRVVRSAAHRAGAAQEGVAAARSGYLPRIGFQTGAVISNTPSNVFMMKLDEARISPATDFSADSLNAPSPRADFSTHVTLEQPLLDLRIGTGVALAEKDAEAARLSVQARKEEIALRVYTSYLEVRRSTAYEAIAKEALADAQEHARLAVVRRENGIGLKSDELRAQTEVAQAEQRTISAANDLTLARLRLNLAVGGTPGEGLDIAEEPRVSEPALGEAELVALALAKRPDLLGAAKQVEGGDLAVRQAENAYLPTLYAGASYGAHDRDLPLGWDHDSWSAGLNLRWELFDGNARSHRAQMARLTRNAAEELFLEQRREAALQVTESILRRKESALRLESARHAVADAEEGMRLVRKRFENGLSPMVEVMDAENALNSARANLVETENGYLRAVAQIYFASGILVQEVMR